MLCSTLISLRQVGSLLPPSRCILLKSCLWCEPTGTAVAEAIPVRPLYHSWQLHPDQPQPVHVSKFSHVETLTELKERSASCLQQEAMQW